MASRTARMRSFACRDWRLVPDKQGADFHHRLLIGAAGSGSTNERRRSFFVFFPFPPAVAGAYANRHQSVLGSCNWVAHSQALRLLIMRLVHRRGRHRSSAAAAAAAAAARRRVLPVGREPPPCRLAASFSKGTPHCWTFPPHPQPITLLLYRRKRRLIYV